jgi:hypothetical protein
MTQSADTAWQCIERSLVYFASARKLVRDAVGSTRARDLNCVHHRALRVLLYRQLPRAAKKGAL